MSSPVYLFLGISGSGKGTQADLLSEKLGLLHISSGELFRTMINENVPEVLPAKSYIEKGVWVPDSLVIQIIMPVIEKKAQQGCILDGIPRTKLQAVYLDDWLKVHDMAIVQVFYLETDDGIAHSRIQGRVMMSEKNKNIRVDEDKDESIQNRFKAFHDSVNPILAYYKAQGTLSVIDNSLPIEQVHDAVMGALRR